ncbi:MAG: magnesium/cobalt transporter CorA [Sandaracinaceae bacterium]|nr:magnesium/cobalt transporter CorA [Sandaracinaceae bacterium]
MSAKRQRRRRRRHGATRVGAPPGTLEALAGAESSTVRLVTFDEAALDEATTLESLDAVRHGVTWVDVVGLGSVDVIQAVGERFGLHALALEDVVHPHQRPKIEEYPDSLYVVIRAPRERDGVLDIEQISMFIGVDFVVTFQEREGDAWDPVRERIRQSKGRVRRMGASYLAYALLDATVDAMFPLLEIYDQRLESAEERVFRSPSPALAEEIHDVDRDLMAVRRAVLPMRESLVRLVRDEHPLIDKDVRIYLRDCLDHLAQMVDLLTGQRDLAKSLSEGHLSSLGHRSNEVMKVLTIIATIFIPLSFIAGLYGMNFDATVSPWNMPELGWTYGYPAALGLMLSVALGMLAYFRRQGWF